MVCLYIYLYLVSAEIAGLTGVLNGAHTNQWCLLHSTNNGTCISATVGTCVQVHERSYMNLRK